jgi:hypothetical protein
VACDLSRVNLAADRTVILSTHIVEDIGQTWSDGIQYRLVGPSAEGHPTAEPVRPSLEDGYVWLMKGVV